MTHTAAPATLIAPSITPGVQSFCDAHLAGIFAHVVADAVEIDVSDTGSRIAQTLESGTLRPVRPILTAAPSADQAALPATFPIGNTKKLIAAHALLFALNDAPAIYLHHLLMQPATELGDLEAAWTHQSAVQRRTFDVLTRLLRMRAEYAAFASDSERHPLELSIEIFALVRTARMTAAEASSTLPLHQRRVVCLVNVSAEEQLVSVDWRAVLGTRHAIRDLVSGVRFNVHGPSLALQPYQVLWATL